LRLKREEKMNRKNGFEVKIGAKINCKHYFIDEIMKCIEKF